MQNQNKKALPIAEKDRLETQLSMLTKKVYLVLGVALPSESGTGFVVTLDANGLLYPFVATSDDIVVTGHELFLKTFFWTRDTIPDTIHITECQTAIYGETFKRVLVGSLFEPLQLILSEIEDLISAQSATIPDERMDGDSIALEVARINSACDAAPFYNPEIVNSTLASSVCEQFFGKSFELFGIRGDGNCFCRCLATIVYWFFTNLETNLEDSLVRTRFTTEFSEVIKSFSQETTIFTASDCHQNVRDLINSHLRLQFSAREFTDVVKNNCANKSNCSNICQCPLRKLFPQLFDLDLGFRAELLNGILSEMNKDDLSHQDIFDFIGTNSKAKEYSACTTMSMGFELLKKYCACQLVTIKHNNRAGDSRFSILGDLQKDDCNLAAIIVFEEHTSENLNHYSILVQSEQKQICIPMIVALSTLRKAQEIKDGIIVEEKGDGVSFEHVDSPPKEDLPGIVKITKKVTVKNEFNALANDAPLQRSIPTTEVPKPRDNASGDSKGDADQTKGVYVSKLTNDEVSEVSLTLTLTLTLIKP